MTSIGPDNVVFLDFYNESIQLEGHIDMLELDMDLLFSRNIFLKDLEKGVCQGSHLCFHFLCSF